MPDGFVRIARFPSSFLGQLAAGRLEAEGLFAIAVDDTVEGVVVASAVYVPEGDADRARAALDRPEADVPAEPEAEPDEEGEDEDEPAGDGDAAPARPRAAAPPAPPSPSGARCPSCGSTEVGEDLRLLPFLPARRRCLRCRTPLSGRRARDARP